MDLGKLYFNSAHWVELVRIQVGSFTSKYISNLLESHLTRVVN